MSCNLESQSQPRCWVCGAVGAEMEERVGGRRCVAAEACEARQPAYLATLQRPLLTNVDAHDCSGRPLPPYVPGAPRPKVKR